MNLPAPYAARRHKWVASGDGSVTLYSLDFKQSHHAVSIGAWTESLHKYVIGSSITQRLASSPVRLLDVGFGVGGNLAATLTALDNTDHHFLDITSLETDPELPNLVAASDFLWPRTGYGRLSGLITNGRDDTARLELIINDAARTVQALTGPFQVIYFDPFSKRTCPHLWEAPVLSRLRRLIADDGVLVTYSAAKGVRRDLAAAGFSVEEIPKLPDGFAPGTLARPR